MRSATLLLASASSVSAGWLRWTSDRERTWVPQETGRARGKPLENGWTPKPTPAPGFKSEGERIMDLLRRQDDGDDSSPKRRTTWLNSRTCGWYSGVSSSALTCPDEYECATDDGAIACASGTFSPYFSVCLNFEAAQSGRCDDVGPMTGCCSSSEFPECGTYLWIQDTPRSLFECFESTTIISMLDVPQAVLDASLSSKTASKTTKTTENTSSSSMTGTESSAPAATSGTSDGGSTGGTVNLGAIIGGVLGGLGLFLIGLILLLCLRRRKKSKKTTTRTKETDNRTYNYVAPNDQTLLAPPSGSENHYHQHYHPRKSSGSYTSTASGVPPQQQSPYVVPNPARPQAQSGPYSEAYMMQQQYPPYPYPNAPGAVSPNYANSLYPPSAMTARTPSPVSATAPTAPYQHIQGTGGSTVSSVEPYAYPAAQQGLHVYVGGVSSGSAGGSGGQQEAIELEGSSVPHRPAASTG